MNMLVQARRGKENGLGVTEDEKILTRIGKQLHYISWAALMIFITCSQVFKKVIWILVAG
jgi:hypothetical protein